MPRHTHDLAHVSIVLQGAYAERYGLKTRSCEPSTLILHPPGEDHSVTFYKAGARVFSIHLSHQWLERVRDYTMVLDGPADFRGGLPSYLAVRLYREFQDADRVSPLMVEGLALEIIAAVSRNASLMERKVPHWLEQAREMLRASLSGEVTLVSVAETVGVHPVYVARQFRKHYRCTVGEYVRRLRVEAACREISGSDAPFSEIAVKVGFYDQSHLTNTFKRLTGMTPAQYRRSFRPS
jgi:AraC family transcriptional regulator